MRPPEGIGLGWVGANLAHLGYPVRMLPRLIPLETLPSWPTAPDPSVLQNLTVFAFIPLGIAAVLTAVIMGPYWAAKRRAASGPDSGVPGQG